MLNESIKETINQLINRTTVSFHIIMPSLRTDKSDFHIQNESDYAIGLAHGMILTEFISEFKDHNKREPNQEEMIEVSKILFERNEELRKSILKSE
jgi:hypothetical protein